MYCAVQWEDNHYAIDSQTADTSSIVDYVNDKNPFHYCESDMRGTSLHYGNVSVDGIIAVLMARPGL